MSTYLYSVAVDSGGSGSVTVTPPAPDAGTSHGVLRATRIMAQFPASTDSGTLELRDSVTNALLWSASVTGFIDLPFLTPMTAAAAGNGLTLTCTGATVRLGGDYGVYTP